MAWERWSAGRVWIGKNGKKTYYGEVAGKMVTTKRHDEESALAELIRLNLGAGTGPIPALSEPWRNEYVQECRERGRDPAGCNVKRSHLQEWAEKVGVRRPTLQLLDQIAQKMTGARNKVATIKAYFTWLRQKGRVARQADPTLDLRKPKANSRDWDRLIPIESHEAVLKVIDQRWADLLIILMGTGMHVSELIRFCRNGTIEGDVLHIRHKSGEPHRVQVSKKVLAAAKRALKSGSFSRIRFYQAIEEACTEAGVPQFDPGGYRHTVASHAVRSGATPEEVAHFLGHKGSYMVKQIYAKTVVPKKIPTME